MPYLIGTDEAGYGPNLGPLVVAAAVWHVPDAPQTCLYRRLRTAVTRDASEALATGRLAIADSKQLYQPARGLADLERGVLACLAAAGESIRENAPPAATFRELLADIATDGTGPLDAVPWHLGHDETLPVAVDSADVEGAAARFGERLARKNVRLLALCASIVQPDRFNDLCDTPGGKASVLSAVTLDLLASVLADLPDDEFFVTCDKHGGRNRYQPLLQERFPEELVEVYKESRALSIYRVGPASRRIEVRFRMEGEAFLPTALASMTAKYLRELAMRAFNAFWRREDPALRPTAGYPSDSHRFRRDIQPIQSRLGIPDHVLWRNR